MSRKINKNLIQLRKSYNSGQSGCVLEGSSRSGKTYSSIDFLVYLASRLEIKGTLNIIKETYNSFKTTLYEDFKRRLPQFGIKSPFDYDIQDIQTFKIFDLKINLIGADKPSKFHGASCDFMWINESVHVAKKIFDQGEMRCRKFWWMDYNPSFEKHYIYDTVIPRPDVDYLKTTYEDNDFISEKELNKILSYDPNNPDNIKNGTADAYMWNVYGLGKRTAQKGLVFKQWFEYTELNEDYDYLTLFGIDWGGNDPTTLIEVNFRRDKPEMYIKEHLYQPLILNNDLATLIKEVNPNNVEVVCDSARKDPRFELMNHGINAIGATKGQGSIIDGIRNMQQYKIFIHTDSENAKNEFNTYRYVVDQKTDKVLNVPEDDNNHIIDPARYCTRYYHLLYGYNYK